MFILETLVYFQPMVRSKRDKTNRWGELNQKIYPFYPNRVLKITQENIPKITQLGYLCVKY